MTTQLKNFSRVAALIVATLVAIPHAVSAETRSDRSIGQLHLAAQHKGHGHRKRIVIKRGSHGHHLGHRHRFGHPSARHRLKHTPRYSHDRNQQTFDALKKGLLLKKLLH